MDRVPDALAIHRDRPLVPCRQPPHVTGVEGQRDTENLCTMFTIGKRQTERCDGDGHYLCAECVHLTEGGFDLVFGEH